MVLAAGHGVQLTGMGRQSERVGVGVTLLFGFTLLVSSREHVGTEFRSPVSVAQRESIFSMRFSFSCPPGKQEKNVILRFLRKRDKKRNEHVPRRAGAHAGPACH